MEAMSLRSYLVSLLHHCPEPVTLPSMGDAAVCVECDSVQPNARACRCGRALWPVSIAFQRPRLAKLVDDEKRQELEMKLIQRRER